MDKNITKSNEERVSFSLSKQNWGRIKVVSNFVWKVAVLVLLILNFGGINYTNGGIDFIAEAIGGSDNSSTATNDFESFKQDRDLGVVSVDMLFEIDEDDYIIMFTDESCPACQDAYDEIVTFLNTGGDERLLILFVDMPTNTALWGDENAGVVTNPSAANFYVTGTPTFLHKNSNGFDVAVGVGGLLEIFEQYN